MTAHRGSARAGRVPKGQEEPGYSCYENLFGLGIWETGGREMEGGDPGHSSLLTGHLPEGHVPRWRIRFLWTQCAQGGRGSRPSSPRHVVG